MASPVATLQRRFKHWRYDPPLKTACVVLVLVVAVVFTLVWLQFRGAFTPKTQLLLLAQRSGLSMDPGSKVTFNGVQIGRVALVDVADGTDVGGKPKAKITLNVDPEYLRLIPQNVDAEIKASTVFGNKYVSFSTPAHPASKRIRGGDVIDVSQTTTEFNTLFETVVSLAEQVDPVKLNETLTATAQALDGLGNRFGESLVNGNAILTDLNPRMPQLRHDTAQLADLGRVYADAAPDVFDGLQHAVTTAATLNSQRGNLDQALMASVGFGNAGGDVLERGGPYLVRGADDLLPSSQLLDEYSPALFCTIRNYHDVQPRFAKFQGGNNGYSLELHNEILAPGNPWVYPENLPRVNAHGGPEGRPGCWQPITRDLWPAPYLVMDTGASIAPYNHLELGQPFALDYVWGRQVGENTINP